MDASEAMSIKPSITDHIDNKETTKNLLKPKDRPMKARRNSADSMVSHIVWSAVVEKFSEMAQEIAGLEGNPEKISRHNGKSETAVSGEQSQNDTVPDSSALEPQDAKSLSAEPIQSDIDLQSPDSPDDTVKSPNDVQMDDAAAKALGAKSEPDLSGPSATSVTLLAVPLTKGSKSPATSSIMKQGSGTGLVDEGNVSDTPSGKGNKYKVIKLKRGRTVRVQSHHASVNVEGDYAAFLKKAIGKHEKDSDATSVKSGKSNRSGKSGAWSTKSGVENGCFR